MFKKQQYINNILPGCHSYRIFAALSTVFCFLFYSPKTLLAQGCPPNIDFEYGNLNNWKFYTGTCCPINATTGGTATSGRHTLTSGTGTDAYGGFPVVAPNGGAYSFKLGNSNTGSEGERAVYYAHIPAGANNYSILLTYAVVLQDPGHSASQQPRFELKAYDSASGKGLGCANFSFVASSSLPGFTLSKVGSGTYYKPWSTMSVNLSGYAGKTVILDFATGDCSLGGHFGYGYFDLSCGLFQINGAICPGVSKVSLTAPSGFSKYEWYDSAFKTSMGTGQVASFTAPKKKTKYAVIITPYSGFGCKDTLYCYVDFSHVSVKSITKDTLICPGKPMALSAKTYDDTIYYPLNKSWSSTGKTQSCNNCDNLKFNPVKSDTFIFRVVDNAGCRDSGRVIVNVRPKLKLIADLNNITACEKTRAGFKLQATAIPGLQYIWYKNNAVVSKPNTDSLEFKSLTLADTGSYRAMVYWQCDTVYTSTVYLKVKPVTKTALASNAFIFCETQKLKLQQTATGTAAFTYKWKKDGQTIKNANTDSLVIKSTTYLDSGTYVAVAVGQCFADSAFVKIKVNPRIVAKYGSSIKNQCFNQQAYVFSDSSSLRWGTYTRLWSLGDNTTAATQYVLKSNYNSGLKTIKLTVVTDQGCKDSQSFNIQIYPSPKAKLWTNERFNCFNEQHFVFTDSSSIAFNKLSRRWYINSAVQSDSSTTIKPIGLSAGLYKISLIAISQHNCRDTQNTTITIYPSPVAKNFINNTSFCLNKQNFLITDLSTLSSGKYQRTWKFGDGTTDTLKIAAHKYANNGKYSIWQVIKSDNACTDSVKVNIEVYPAPTANLQINNAAQCYKEQAFVLKDNSSISYNQLYRQWILDNKVLSDTGNTLKPLNLKAGTHKIILIPNSQNGCMDTIIKTLTVFPSPIAKYIVTDTNYCQEKQQFEFLDSTTLSGGKYKRLWKLGDGNTDTSQIAKPRYAKEGTYGVAQIITTDKGCTDSLAFKIRVFPAPKAQLAVNAPAQCNNEQSFQLSDQSSIAYGVLFRLWYIDGLHQPDTGKILQRKGLAVGTHQAVMVQLSNFDCSDTQKAILTVYASPVAKHTVNDTNFCLEKQQFLFTDSTSLSTGTFATVWKTGDGKKTNGKQIKYKYTNHGKFKVWHVVNTNKGCKDSEQFQLEVFPTPVAINLVNNAAQCNNEQNFVFKDNSSIAYNKLTRLWYIDNILQTDTAITLNPKNLNAGKHSVDLIPLSEYNCSDTQTQTITVFPSPLAMHYIKDTSFCFEKQNFYYLDSSRLSTGNYTVNWDFGDGTFEAGKSVRHIYNQDGIYSIVHVVTTDKQCTDSSLFEVIVHPKPMARFTIVDSARSMPMFTNESVYGRNFFWEIDNGLRRTTTDLNPITDLVFDFKQKRNYLVQLKVLTQFGCEDTVSHMLHFMEPYIYIPNSIVLNNTSVNKTFQISCFRCLQYSLKLYDRWGQVVYQSPVSEKFPAWDGTYKGQPVMDGVYVYLVTAIDYSGHSYFKNGSLQVFH